MIQYVVSYQRDTCRSWRIADAFDNHTAAITCAHNLFMDFVGVSEWIEIRITRLQGYKHEQPKQP